MLDPNIDRKLILERVFTRGTENDEREIFNYYGKETIKMNGEIALINRIILFLTLQVFPMLAFHLW
jgi:hypothetical protein